MRINAVVSSMLENVSRLTKREVLSEGFVVDKPTLGTANVYRNDALEKYDAYFENRQYASLPDFDFESPSGTSQLTVRQKQPRIKAPFARSLASRVASKLIGPSVFPQVTVADQPDDQEYWRAVLDVSQLQMFLLEPMRRMINTGAVFVRFHIDNGTFKKEWYSAKFCYPTFAANGELESISIRYVFSDESDKNEMGTPKRKWFRMDLDQDREITFDNPEFVATVKDPEFTPVETIEHGFGFVQGEWLTSTGIDDGYGLVADICEFIDELSYSLSQSSKAVSYNQDPQLTFSGMTGDELDSVVRSAEKSWNLGRDGKAGFLESNLAGVGRATELRDKVTQNLAQLSRVVLLDPEKIVGSAQSAKAMEVLHGPLKDMVDELRLPVGSGLKKLILKMGAANYLGFEMGMAVPIPLPEGYVMQSMDIVLKWPAIFQQTLEDTQKKVSYTAQALSGGLIGPRTAVRHIAETFDIQDVDAELVDIQAHAAAVAALNPFSGGF